MAQSILMCPACASTGTRYATWTPSGKATGLTLGAANQISGVNAAGTAIENKALTVTSAGLATFPVQPIFSTLTASLPVFTDGLKGLVSNAMTGTGNVMMSASPTTTGTLTAEIANFSGAVGIPSTANSSVLMGNAETAFQTNEILTVSGGVIRNVRYASNGGLNIFRANGSFGAPSAILTGQLIGSVYFFGYGASTYQNATAKIEAEATENYANAAMGTRILIGVTPIGSITSALEMSIAATGVGITHTLIVSGATTLQSTADVTGNFNVNTNKFTVVAANGNTQVAGTFGVTGTTTAAAANWSGNQTITSAYLFLTGAGAELRIANSNSSLTSLSSPFIGATSTTGVAYPYLEAGNLIFVPRTSGAARDIVFYEGGGTIAGRVLRTTGILEWGYGFKVYSDNTFSTAKFTVTAASGNTDIQGTLGVTGVLTASNTTDATALGTASIVTLGGISVAKRLILDGATGKTLRIVNAVANAAVLVTFPAAQGPTGSTAGGPQGWMRIDINGTDRYIPFW